MKDLTLRQLRFLDETVRSGSLAGAAATLHLTPPAIAQQLRQLERSVGLPLLERGPGGQQPTEAGRLLLATYARVDTELRSCADELAALAEASTGQVAIGAVSTAKYFAPHVIAAFGESHPGVSVTISIGNRHEVIAMLEDHAVDLAIMGRPPRQLEVEQEVFGEHPYVLVARPEHRLARRRRLTWDDLADETFLVREPGSGTRQHLENLFATSAEGPRTGMEIPSNETIKQAVMAGLGIALISAHTVAAEVADGRLAVLPLRTMPIRRHWLVVRLASRRPSPATRAMWDYVVTHGAGHLPSVATGR